MFDIEKAKELASLGYNKSVIAARLGCSYSQVSKYVKNAKKSLIRRSVSVLHSKVGSRISELLVKENLTVKQLCYRSGLHQAVISRILTGSQDLRLSELDRIATALKVDLKELL